MQVLKMMSVRDRTAEFFYPPFFVRSSVEAMRAFERLMADPNKGGAASEYDLIELGEFQDDSGGVIVHDVPRILSNGRDVVPKE